MFGLQYDATEVASLASAIYMLSYMYAKNDATFGSITMRQLMRALGVYERYSAESRRNVMPNTQTRLILFQNQFSKPLVPSPHSRIQHAREELLRQCEVSLCDITPAVFHSRLCQLVIPSTRSSELTQRVNYCTNCLILRITLTLHNIFRHIQFSQLQLDPGDSVQNLS